MAEPTADSIKTPSPIIIARISKTVNIMLDPLMVGHAAVIALLAAVTFLIPFIVPISDDPTNRAGWHAALIAVWMTSLLLAELEQWGSPYIRQIRRAVIAVCVGEVRTSGWWGSLRLTLPTSVCLG